MMKQGSRKVLAKGENLEMSAVETANHIDGDIEVMERNLRMLESMGQGVKGGEETVMDALSLINEEEEGTDGEGFSFGQNPIQQDKSKKIRCLIPTFAIMVININNSFGAKLLGPDYRQKYSLFFKDPYKIFLISTIIGALMGYSGIVNLLPSFCSILVLLVLPIVLIVFCSTNLPLSDLVSLRFFTILKSFFVLIYSSSGIILSRERKNSFAVQIFFIISGIIIYFGGLFGDAFYLPWRNTVIKRNSVITSILLGITIILLHTGSLDVQDYRVEFMGHFNFSVITFMAGALNNLFWLNMEIVYIAFIDPNRLVTLFNPIKNVKIKKAHFSLMRGAANTSVSKSEESFSFPATLNTVDSKIKYVKERIDELRAQFKKWYATLSDEEKSQVDKRKVLSRGTEMIGNQVETLMKSIENEEEVYVITSPFLAEEIDSTNTLGRMLIGAKASQFISKCGIIFFLMFLIGMVCVLLAMNRVISDTYALAAFFCAPAPINILMMNIMVLKKLIFQFENTVMSVSSFIFCVCGCVLLRERNYNRCFFLFFISLWFIGLYENWADSLPGASRRQNIILVTVSGLIVYFTIMFGVCFDHLQGQDFVMPLFGSLNFSIANQCAISGLTCIIFMFKNLFHAISYPDQLVTLKGRLYFSKMKMSEVQVLQGINKVVSVGKNLRNISIGSV